LWQFTFRYLQWEKLSKAAEDTDIRLHRGIIIAALFLFSPLRPENAEPNHAVPLFLSMVIPGGGQAYNGRYFKAAIYAVMEGVMVYGAYIQNERLEDSKENLGYYKETGDFYKVAEYEFYVSRYRKERNNFIWMGIGTALLSAGDAYVDSKFKSFRRDLFQPGDKVSLSLRGSCLALIYEW
jgi:hypothetical protein